MAKRIDLRAYQESIASRLAAAQAGTTAPALLGFASGGTRWLIELPAAGEVLPLPVLAPVPLTQAWFAGLANIHGELEAVADFSIFCGGAPTAHDAGARILRIGARQGSNMALLVARVHGLKRTDALFAVEAEDMAGTERAAHTTVTPGWRGVVLTDTQGQHWTRLDLDQLLNDPDFLDAALPEAILNPSIVQ